MLLSAASQIIAKGASSEIIIVTKSGVEIRGHVESLSVEGFIVRNEAGINPIRLEDTQRTIPAN